MKVNQSISLAAVAAVLVMLMFGCATPYTTESRGFTSFLVYDGKQQRWPREENRLVRNEFAVPVYRGLPSKAYQIIGVVVPSEGLLDGQSVPSVFWGNETRMANAANQAKGYGADAVAITSNPEIIQALNLRVGEAQVLSDTRDVIIAIKW